MRHHILVKWDTTQPRPDLRAIDQLFQQTLEIPGIHSVSLHPNVVARPNRYDLLILLCMERDALAPMMLRRHMPAGKRSTGHALPRRPFSTANDRRTGREEGAEQNQQYILSKTAAVRCG